MEIWKDVKGFEDYYQASNIGRVRSKDRYVKKWHKSGGFVIQFYEGKVLKNKICKKGYVRLHISVNGKRMKVYAHAFVLLAFVGEKPEGYECCHNNGIGSDNRIENLRWDNHFNNNQDRVKHGTYPKGENHPMYGRPMPDWLKKLHRELNLGAKRSEKVKEKMSAAQFSRWEKIKA